MHRGRDTERDAKCFTTHFLLSGKMLNILHWNIFHDPCSRTQWQIPSVSQACQKLTKMIGNCGLSFNKLHIHFAYTASATSHPYAFSLDDGGKKERKWNERYNCNIIHAYFPTLQWKTSHSTSVETNQTQHCFGANAMTSKLLMHFKMILHCSFSQSHDRLFS